MTQQRISMVSMLIAVARSVPFHALKGALVQPTDNATAPSHVARKNACLTALAKTVVVIFGPMTPRRQHCIALKRISLILRAQSSVEVMTKKKTRTLAKA
jgi:hypothetical protein